jgi:hypothetical protein
VREGADPLARAAELAADPLAHSPRAARGCPPADRLIALAERSLPAAEREPIVDHLAGCPDCAAELRTLREVDAWAREAGAAVAGAGVGSRAAGAGWRMLVAAGVGALACGLALGWLLWRTPGAAPTAATVDGAERTLALRLADERTARATLERELATAREHLALPLANVPLVDLAPEGTLRSASAARDVPQPPAGTPLVLVLSAREHQAAARYELRVHGPDGAEVTRVEALRPSVYGTFTVGLPAASLEPGTYRLELWAPAQGPAEATAPEARLVERYVLRLVAG